MDPCHSQLVAGQDFPAPARSEERGNDMFRVEVNGMTNIDMFGRKISPLQTSEQGNGQRMNQNVRRSSSSEDPAVDAPMKQHQAMQQQAINQFGGQAPGGSHDNFHFSSDTVMNQNALSSANTFVANSANSANLQGQQSTQQMNHPNQNMISSAPFSMFSPTAAYPTSANLNGQNQMGIGGSFSQQNTAPIFDYTDPSIAAMMRNGMVPMRMMPQGQIFPNGMIGPSLQTMGLSTHQKQQQVSSNTVHSPVSAAEQSPSSSDDQTGLMSQTLSRSGFLYDPSKTNLSQNYMTSQMMSNQMQQSQMLQGFYSDQNSQQPAQQYQSPSGGSEMAWDGSTRSMSSSMPIRPQQKPQISYANAYSSTGFDMLTVLMKIATRKNPEIQLGAVDLSCAFVVCDVLEHDFPIVYCSENFERLTGYTKHEILGRNCRFLQAPGGKVQAGIKRSYVDDDSVLYLKNCITARREAQVNLINYRKGGQPFMNLLTMIPVSYDTDEIRFFIGLQVDLVEQPNSVTNKNPNGSYKINYQRGLTMPRYVFSGDEKQVSALESGQTISRDEVSNALSAIGAGESEHFKRIWDKVLLENADDVIFVLSLKGLFLFLSPSSKTTLEYDAAELMGTALSSVCHPSDIVPVTRELKDTTSAISVDVVFRIRRKHTGYMWLEAHGALHTEQGKGRKSIVLVGRERPVYTLAKPEILAGGGINDNEVWTKLSTSGTFLFVSSNIRALLDRLPSELVGTSIRALMLQDTYSDFVRAMEVARSGRRATAKHELMNRRGQVLQAYSVLYPGDARNDQKPTFFVAQTRLLKWSRSPAFGASMQRSQATIKEERNVPNSDAGSAAPPSPVSASANTNTNTNTNNAPTIPRPASATMSGHSSGNGSLKSTQSQYMTTFEAAATYSGQQGLPLGHQDIALASAENLFDELKTTRSTSWQFELRQMEKRNRLLAEELQSLLAARKKRKRRKGVGDVEKDCANCHTKTTPEWRRGPSGNRDLCNSCGLRWAKQQGRISPRMSSQRSAHSAKSDKANGSPLGAGPNLSPSQPAPAAAARMDDEESVGTRSIDDVMSQTHQQYSGDSGESSQHVSKAAKIEGSSPRETRPVGMPTTIEDVDAKAEAG